MSIRDIFVEQLHTSLEDVSDEEGLYCAVSAMEALAEANETVKDMERMVDIGDGLESMVVIGDSIKNADRAHHALFMNGTNLALAGTGLTYQDVAPGLESDDDTVSLEGVRDMVKRVYDAIVRQLKKLWAKMKEFWYNMTASAPKLVKAAEKMRKRAEAAMSKSSDEKKISLGREANALTMDGALVSDTNKIKDGLGLIQEMVKGMYTQGGKDLKEMGESIESALSDFDVEDAKSSLVNLCTAIDALAGKETSFPNENTTTLVDPDNDDRRHATDANTLRGESMLGSKAVFVTVGNDPTNKAQNPLSWAQALRRYNIQILDRKVYKKDALEDGDIQTLQPGEISDLCDKIIDIATMIGTYDKSKIPGDLNKLNDKIKKHTDKLAKQAEKNKDDTSEESAYIRSGLDFLRFYGVLCQQPQAQLASTAFAACRAILAASSKSLSTFK